MKINKLSSTLVVMGFLFLLILASQNVRALPDGITLSPTMTTETITIDGQMTESAWSGADVLIVPSIHDSGINVILSALIDDAYIYVFAAWNDSTEDNTRRAWSYNGTNWENVGGNEDRITLAWSSGASIVCGHNPASADALLFDVWHWKASRTAPAGWADDKYWDGYGRQSDAKTAGGYSENSVVVQADNASAITTALGNSTNVAAYSNDDRPFWDNNGVEITWTNGINATPVGDFIDGYKTEIPTGSRGDLIAGSVHNGTAWNVEFRRALDTGNTDDDIAFSPGSTIPFYLAVHNNSGDAAHFVAGGFSSPITFQLNIPSSSPTTTPTSTTTPTTPTTLPAGIDSTLLIGVAVAVVLVLVVIVVYTRRQ
ncbi:MAG: ethylbenzene dehydrogenase-related protein [Candidatus Thorarchaeota archaeon]